MSLSKSCILPISWYTEVFSGFHKGALQSYFKKRRGENVNMHAVPFP